MTTGSNMKRRRESAQKHETETYNRRRRELIEAAARLFREKGYAQTSLNDVANALKTDRASVYYYVSSKKELLHEVVRDVVAETANNAKRISESAGPAPEKLRALIFSLMRSYAQNYPYQFVYIQEGMAVDSHGDAQLNRLGKQYEAALIDIINGGIRDGSFRNTGDSKIIAYGILGMLNWTHRWFNPSGRLTPDQVAATFADTVLGGLKPL
jgi:TetR/AcrR family transcriptional regulator, cholesterol catabolism regulator